MENNILLVLVCAGALVSHSVIGADTGDTKVFIGDDSTAMKECGLLQNLDVIKDPTTGLSTIELELTGGCLGSSDYNVLLPTGPLKLNPVSEGDVADPLDASPGVVAKWPITVTVNPSSPATTDKGGVAWVTDGTVINYEPPAAGTISTASEIDTFAYTVTDADGKDNTGTVEVEVIQTPAESPIATLTGPCNDDATLGIECIGDVDITHLGTTQHRKATIIGGRTHVWTITGRSVEGVLEFRYLTSEMTVSLTENYLGDSTEPYCTRDVVSSSLRYSEDGAIYKCQLKPGIQYYLRVTSSVLGTYEFHW